MVQEITQALDTEVHEPTAAQDTEAQDTEVKETTAAQDTEDQETTEAQDTEVKETTEAQDTEVKETTAAQDTEDQETTEAQDTIVVQKNSKETDLQFIAEKVLEQQKINKIVMNLIKKILRVTVLLILIHFILLLGPNYLLYLEKKNVLVVDLIMKGL